MNSLIVLIHESSKPSAALLFHPSYLCLTVPSGIFILVSKGYHPHASLDGVHEQQTSRSVDLLVLLLDVARDFLQDLEQNKTEENGFEHGPVFICTIGMKIQTCCLMQQVIHHLNVFLQRPLWNIYSNNQSAEGVNVNCTLSAGKNEKWKEWFLWPVYT